LIYNTYNSEASGYGLQVKLGKTSLTEGWNGGASQDHFMFGEISEWMFSHLAGIQCDPAAPGFKKIVIAPAVVSDLTEVKASYDSIEGKIVSEWKRTGPRVRFHIVIPPNTTATIDLPGESAPRHVGSGDYAFNSSVRPASSAQTGAR
jgi:alpha-L-rhamnosidase